MNFLIVDDNRLLNRFLSTFLRSKGHSAATLADPTKTLAWLELNPCDAIILEISMPKIDGITLLREHIRPIYPALPTVIFTRRGYDEGLMADSRRAGANSYISKGLGPSEIYNVLMRLLSVPSAAPAS